jgi:hypothetical protein
MFSSAFAHELSPAVGCNSSTCPHPVGPIILHALGTGGIIAILIVVLGLILAILIWGRGGGRWGGWGDSERMG